MATSPAPQPSDAAEPSEAASAVQAAIDQAADAAASASRLAKANLAAARETLGHVVDEASLLGSECTETARSVVRAKPLTAIVAAMALGLLVGRLCR